MVLLSEVDITVHVNDDAETNEPKTQPIAVNQNEEPDPADAITNIVDLPADTSFEFKIL